MDNPEFFEVPHNHDDLKVGEIYEIKVNNIFDPSKLWVIINYKELILFTKYLKIFYGNDKNRIRIPKFKIKKYLLCIVKRNSDYYRAIILPILFPDENKLRVFLIDEGTFINVNIENIFYILEKHTKVPRFALRACMVNVVPNCFVWSTQELQFLLELIVDKQLFSKIEGINPDNKILYIDIFIKDMSKSSQILQSVTQIMLKANIASQATPEPKLPKEKTKYLPTVMYPHLYPTIEAIEEGKVPSSLWEQNLAKDVPLDLLLPSYYKYQDINSHV